MLRWCALPAAALVAGLACVGCSGSGRAPYNVRLAAETDSTVRVSWSVPAEGTPDAYSVYFKSPSDSVYGLIAETTASVYFHDPAGATGFYRVTAWFNGQEYEAVARPGTVPVRTDTTAVAELNAPGNSGYGWNRETGGARTYSMRTVNSRDRVDFYVTDFKPAASNQLPYSIASPDMGPADLGGVVPTDSWRVNVFTDPLSDEQAPLPAYDPDVYFCYVDVNRTPCLVGCYTEDDCYALIKVTLVNVENSWVQVETWFQPVVGLRLIRH